ncbi:SymE family type I addiction module toxin [Paraburkholderia sp. A1RI-2L]|uniref:SymE family type I addiction module toxin n=1 Tax=Paraburkholderia sp. A1RI-2L TaxID=3028367 RepID=UPI003B7A8486
MTCSTLQRWYKSRHRQAEADCRRINARTRTEPSLCPWIKLSGRWLELAGFAAGQFVRIAVEHGRLFITHD